MTPGDSDAAQPQRAPHSVRAAAVCLHARGFKLVRLRGGTKMAFERGWPDLERRPDDVQPTDNIGLRFGPDCGGLCDIDLDSPKARALASFAIFGISHLPEFGRQSQKAGRRGHRLVVVKDTPDLHRVFGVRSKRESMALKNRGLPTTIIEFRGSKGTQSAVPPSVLIDGKGVADRLVWSDPAGCRVDIPEMGLEDLLKRLGHLAFCALAAAIAPDEEGDKSAHLSRLQGAFAHAGGTPSVAADMAAAVATVIRFAGNMPKADSSDLSAFFDGAGLGQLAPVAASWLQLHETGAPKHQAKGTMNSGAGGISAEQLERLLNVLDPDDFTGHHDWLSLLFAAHDATHGVTAARDVFVDWCGGIPGYGDATASREVIKAWDSASNADSKRRKITVRTLIAQVRAAGRADVVEQIFGQPTTSHPAFLHNEIMTAVDDTLTIHNDQVVQVDQVHRKRRAKP